MPYATANGSDTMRSASAIPFTAPRKCSRDTRSASAGTPTTAWTDWPSFLPASEMRCFSSSCTASSSFADPCSMRPRSSGRCRSSIGRFSSASAPKRIGFFTTFLATMSRGQPT